MQDLVDHASIETITLDVCSADSIAAAKDRVAEITGGALDILVNNACVRLSLALVSLLKPHYRH